MNPHDCYKDHEKTYDIWDTHHCLPSGKLTELWKITIFNEQINYKWQFSIAIFVYQSACFLPKKTNKKTMISYDIPHVFPMFCEARLQGQGNSGARSLRDSGH